MKLCNLERANTIVDELKSVDMLAAHAEKGGALFINTEPSSKRQKPFVLRNGKAKAALAAWRALLVEEARAIGLSDVTQTLPDAAPRPRVEIVRQADGETFEMPVPEEAA